MFVRKYKVNNPFIFRIKQKLLIHSDEEKAAAFTKLTETFLESPAFEGRCEKVVYKYFFPLININLVKIKTDKNR